MYKTGDVLKNVETGEIMLVLMANEVSVRFFNPEKPEFDDMSNVKTKHVWLDKLNDDWLHVGNVDDMIGYVTKSIAYSRSVKKDSVPV